jgi:hypothetical protein
MFRFFIILSMFAPVFSIKAQEQTNNISYAILEPVRSDVYISPVIIRATSTCNTSVASCKALDTLTINELLFLLISCNEYLSSRTSPSLEYDIEIDSNDVRFEELYNELVTLNASSLFRSTVAALYNKSTNVYCYELFYGALAQTKFKPYLEFLLSPEQFQLHNQRLLKFELACDFGKPNIKDQNIFIQHSFLPELSASLKTQMATHIQSLSPLAMLYMLFAQMYAIYESNRVIARKLTDIDFVHIIPIPTAQKTFAPVYLISYADLYNKTEALLTTTESTKIHELFKLVKTPVDYETLAQRLI